MFATGHVTTDTRSHLLYLIEMDWFGFALVSQNASGLHLSCVCLDDSSHLRCGKCTSKCDNIRLKESEIIQAQNENKYFMRNITCLRENNTLSGYQVQRPHSTRREAHKTTPPTPTDHKKKFELLVITLGVRRASQPRGEELVVSEFVINLDQF